MRPCGRLLHGSLAMCVGLVRMGSKHMNGQLATLRSNVVHHPLQIFIPLTLNLQLWDIPPFTSFLSRPKLWLTEFQQRWQTPHYHAVRLTGYDTSTLQLSCTHPEPSPLWFAQETKVWTLHITPGFCLGFDASLWNARYFPTLFFQPQTYPNDLFFTVSANVNDQTSSVCRFWAWSDKDSHIGDSTCLFLQLGWCTVGAITSKSTTHIPGPTLILLSFL